MCMICIVLGDVHLHIQLSLCLCIYLSYVLREDIHIGMVQDAGEWRKSWSWREVRKGLNYDTL